MSKEGEGSGKVRTEKWVVFEKEEQHESCHIHATVGIQG